MIRPVTLELACFNCGNAHGGSCDDCERRAPDTAPGYRCDCGAAALTADAIRHYQGCAPYPVEAPRG